MIKQTQWRKVYQIVLDAGSFGIRTEQVERQGLLRGISGGSVGRYLRWCQEGIYKGYTIKSRYENGNRTKSWWVPQEQQGKLFQRR